MKAGIVVKIILALGIAAVFSCGQHPIFYTISTETPPQKALISGSPTNMAVFNRNGTDVLYVASGRLHWYAKNSGGDAVWNSADYFTEQPGGRIIALAASADYLYALCMKGHGIETTLKRIGSSDEKWESIDSEAGTYPLIQSIHADPGGSRMFAGAQRKDSMVYGILYLDDSGAIPALKLLNDETTLLSGAVLRGGIHYLSTRGRGIFQVNEADLAGGNASGVMQQENNSDGANTQNRLFMGMIKLDDAQNTIIAVERDGGSLFEVNGGGFERIKHQKRDEEDNWVDGDDMKTGSYATGALALWTNDNRNMLVAGIQGGLYNTVSSSYTHGYVEFEINDDGSLNKNSSRRDPGNLVTIIDNEQDRYKATLGKYPLNHLFQTPAGIDSERTFFASTQNVGLWSYRLRSNKWQWNAEN